MLELMKDNNIQTPEKLSNHFNKQRFHISKIKDRIWELMIDEKGKERGIPNWAKDFHLAYSKFASEKEREIFLNNDDLLMKIAAIWGASNSNQKELLDKICKKERNSESWEIQASLTISPHCSPEYLHHIATGTGKEMGYGYILRIVSRNPNVKKETLEAIANDQKIEARYSQCAKAALNNGKGAANHQI